MKASELVESLRKLIDEHGDAEVFSVCDWDFVGGVIFEGPDTEVPLSGCVAYVIEA